MQFEAAEAEREIKYQNVSEYKKGNKNQYSVYWE